MFCRFLGVLQPLELPAYDLLMRLKIELNSGIEDPRIRIVGISNHNLIGAETEISDQRLLKLLEKLNDSKPRLIGLDIYRDRPHPFACEKNQQQQVECKKHNDTYEAKLIPYLESKDNIITICKVGKNRPGSNPPSEELLKEKRVSFSDIIFDAKSSGVIRRHLVSMKKDVTSPCKTDKSFSYQIAFHYLKKQDEKKDLEEIVANHRLGKDYVGGYQGVGPFKIDLEGSQILLNWRNASSGNPFQKIITLDEVSSLKMEDLSDLIEDRVVLVGYTTRFTERGDFHNTLIDPKMPGVVLQAHKVSQLLSAVLKEKDRLLISVWPQQYEFFLLVFWSWICGEIMIGREVIVRKMGWRWRLRLLGGQTLRIRLLIMLALPLLACWLAFINLGWWLPLVPSVLVWILNGSFVLIMQNRK